MTVGIDQAREDEPPRQNLGPGRGPERPSARAGDTRIHRISVGKLDRAYPPSRHETDRTWVAVHQGCPPQSAGLASGIGSVSEALTYTADRWGFVPSDLSSYGHGSIKKDIAAAKAAGYCGKT
jgi:hypothetical protein